MVVLYCSVVYLELKCLENYCACVLGVWRQETVQGWENTGKFPACGSPKEMESNPRGKCGCVHGSWGEHGLMVGEDRNRNVSYELMCIKARMI